MVFVCVANRGIKTPATDMIYQTLNSNKKLLDTYNQTISGLTSQLVKLRVHNTSAQWQTRHGGVTSRASPARDNNKVIEDVKLTSPAAAAGVYSPRTLGQRVNRKNLLNRCGVWSREVT